MPKLSPTWAERFLPYLEAAMREFGITTKQRRCAFLAQLAVESNELTRWREDLNYKAQRLMVVFPTKFKTITQADEYAHNPERIANRVYANRMENGPEASGDGWRFRGRGPIQLTGRANYRIFGGELGLPLEDDPDLAAQYEHGFRIAGLYWRRGGCNSLADKLTMRVTTTIGSASSTLPGASTAAATAWPSASTISELPSKCCTAMSSRQRQPLQRRRQDHLRQHYPQNLRRLSPTLIC
jgi:putative chitinase